MNTYKVKIEEKQLSRMLDEGLVTQEYVEGYSNLRKEYPDHPLCLFYEVEANSVEEFMGSELMGVLRAAGTQDDLVILDAKDSQIDVNVHTQ